MGNASQKLWIIILTFGSFSILFWFGLRFIQWLIREYDRRYVQREAQTLEEMFIFMDPKTLLRWNLGVAAIFIVLGLALGKNIAVTVLIAGMGAFFPRFYVWRLRKKRVEQFDSQLVDGLIILSNALRAGQTLIQAIGVLEEESPAPLSQEFGIVLREYRLGVGMTEALQNLSERIDSDDLNLLVTSINIVHGMGGNLAEVFGSMSYVIRERNKLEGKTKALTSQGKMQALVVGLLPTFLGVVLYFMDPASMMRMLNTTIGNVLLGIMFVFQITGYLLIRKVTTIEV